MCDIQGTKEATLHSIRDDTVKKVKGEVDAPQLSSVLLGVGKHLQGVGANGDSAQSSRMAPHVWTHGELLCERRDLGDNKGRISILSQSKRKRNNEP